MVAAPANLSVTMDQSKKVEPEGPAAPTVVRRKRRGQKVQHKPAAATEEKVFKKPAGSQQKEVKAGQTDKKAGNTEEAGKKGGRGPQKRASRCDKVLEWGDFPPPTSADILEVEDEAALLCTGVDPSPVEAKLIRKWERKHLLWQIARKDNGKIITMVSSNGFPHAGLSKISAEVLLGLHESGASSDDLQVVKRSGLLFGVKTGRKVGDKRPPMKAMKQKRVVKKTGLNKKSPMKSAMKSSSSSKYNTQCVFFRT